MKIQQDFSDYVLNNPGYTGLQSCPVLPGVSCRSMNVKVPGTIDLETNLLRGKPSDLEALAALTQKEQPMEAVQAQPKAAVRAQPMTAVQAQPFFQETRVSKSCYFEQPIDRFINPGYPELNNTVLAPELRIGESARDQGKKLNHCY